MRFREVTYLLLGLLLVLGCGAADFDSRPATDVTASDGMAVTDDSGPTATADTAGPLPTESAIERKIVYTAEVDVVVEEFDEVPSQVKSLAVQNGGYIAKSTSADDRAVLAAANGQFAYPWRTTKTS